MVDEYEVELIVVGLPKHMNNDLGERADRTLYFVKRIERELGIPVATFDERLSTVAAERVLTEGNVRKNRTKKIY